ncbi:DNA topology modulation protein [Bacillus carboniphilus]|uniref:DNA topology modulation protein n=1 Tax=Bacillus carboniphilus TaxID=86663 RepID=A0ABN0VQ48_9BACI
MKKILIIGSGGAGKSTLAKKLGELLHFPVYHLDSIFWKENWTPSNREEFRQNIRSVMEKEEWILDGNFGSTLDMRLKHCDTVVFLDYPSLTCVYGVVKRRIQYNGKTRPDMGENCKEKLDWEFLKWVYTYRKKKAPEIRKKLSELTNVKVITLQSRKETKRFLQSLS